MRISDWSSDVCSSDLGDGTGTQKPDPGLLLAGECRAFRPVARLLRPFHLAHSPLFRSGGASFAGARLRAWAGQEIGRASCRERVCQYVSISGVAVSLKKKE